MKKILTVIALLTAPLGLASCSGGNTPVVDTTAPTVTLTATPDKVNDETPGGVLTLSAVATDDVGVTRVTFYEGANEISSDTTAPYEAVSNLWGMDLTDYNGHSLTYRAVATDAAGNTTETTLEVPAIFIHY